MSVSSSASVSFTQSAGSSSSDQPSIDLPAIDQANGWRFAGPILLLSFLWIIATSIIGTLGLFESQRDSAHAGVLLAVSLPTVIYGLLFLVSPGVRNWTRKLDLAMLTLPHAWRTVGYSFLALWFYGVLPAGFAAPAGFGDFAVAMVAPFVAVALWLKWRGAIRVSVWFHVLGFLDLFIALLTGITGFGVAKEAMTQIDPMTAFPMVIIPTVFVPLLILSHVMALVKIGMIRR